MSTPTTSPNTPTFILVPGHWHTTTHAQPLITTLQASGHKAKTIQLASVGLKSPRPTFADDISTIQTAVASALSAGEDVCLILHSYAGMPGAEAINRLHTSGALDPTSNDKDRGRLVKALFIAAYTFPAGIVMDAADFVGPSTPGLTIDDEGMNRMATPEHFFFNDLPASEAQQWVRALEPAYYMGREPVISSEEWRKAVSVTALLCKRDNAVPPERQGMVWQGMETEWIDAAHTPFVSRPEEVAGIVVRLAQAGAEAK